MCIAIYKPAGKSIDRETLYRCYTANPDGCGFSFINRDGELDIYASMDFDTFHDTYESCLEESPSSPFLIHFRIATHGVVDETNCHPFFIENGDETVDKVFMHNGTITPMTKYCNKSTGNSDTVEFGLRVLEKLEQLNLLWHLNDGIKHLVEEFIGWSKIVVMDKEGDVTIYNEHKGVWDGDVWYSNESYKKKEPKPLKKYDWGSSLATNYVWIGGVRCKWSDVHREYREVDYTGKFIEAEEQDEFEFEELYDECDFCNTFTRSVDEYTSEGIKYNLCKSCKYNLEKAGIKLEEVF